MEILDFAFLVAATAFFKEQFSLSGKQALLAAFGVALFIGFAPVIGESLPALSPYLEAAVKVVALFIGGAGSYDLFVDVGRKISG